MDEIGPGLRRVCVERRSFNNRHKGLVGTGMELLVIIIKFKKYSARRG